VGVSVSENKKEIVHEFQSVKEKDLTEEATIKHLCFLFRKYISVISGQIGIVIGGQKNVSPFSLFNVFPVPTF
jgi:hypothetical protein